MTQQVPDNTGKLSVQLRAITSDDLPGFFQMQLDKEANYMAAFTARDPSDRVAFEAHWSRILADETIVKRAVLFEEQVVGSILSFEHVGKREVCYWIEKEQWGKGIATRALEELLRELKHRPLHAHVARDNAGSIRVLEKCGFVVTGYQFYMANARGQEIEEAVLELK
jgi:RimJ/RimL family protein N-acetyltransferase